MTGKPCVLALLLVAAMVAQARSQAVGSGAVRSKIVSPAAVSPVATGEGEGKSTRRPGVMQNGRFLGFVPAHETIVSERNLQLPAGQQLTSSLERETRGPEITDTGIAQANYEVVTGPVVGDSGSCGVCGGSCGTDCVNPCAPCGPRFRDVFQLWGSASYVHWWTGGSDFPSLVTTSPDGTIQDDAGVLPAATTLFGGDELFDDSRSGGRFALGMWLNPERSLGLEITYLLFSNESTSFSASDADFPILARPFFNVSLAEEDSRLIAFDGLVSGNLSIATSTSLDAFDVALRRPLSYAAGARSDFIIGYRHGDLDEAIRFDESTTALSGAVIDTDFELFDQFDVENEFHGGEIGLEYRGPTQDFWSLGLLGKIAFGTTRSRLVVNGQTTTTPDGGTATTNPGGLLTQASNIGTFNDDTSSTMIECGVTLRRMFANGLSFNVGYNFFYWSDVATIAGQIDRRVNPSQILPGTLTGAALPEALFTRDDFHAHGLSFGLEYAF